MLKYVMLVLAFPLLCARAHSRDHRPPEPGLYVLQGKINSTIPVFLWFTVRDSVVFGQVTYTRTKNAAPIRLLGMITSEGARINEFSSDGTITGIFTGQLNGHTLTGTWFSPKTRKDYPLSLTPKDTVIKNKETDYTTKSVAGTYFYSYGKAGAQGTLKVKQANPASVSLDFFDVTDPSARNTAELTLDKVAISNNEVSKTLEDTPSCAFRVRFFKGFVVVNYINNQRACGFGNNAFIDGVYLKK